MKLRAVITVMCISWMTCIPLQGQPVLTPEQPQSSVIIEPNIVTHPGIVAWRDGKWLWSDHLFNLTSNIDIDVEFTVPDNMLSLVNKEKVEAIVEEIFKKDGITPYAAPEPGKPNLPIFHLLIMAHPVRDGYAFATIARLLEPVQLDRIKLDDRVTMQAITWERSSIHVVHRADFEKELDASIREVVTEFANRYAFFEKLRLKSK
jgi:hypothetical protein